MPEVREMPKYQAHQQVHALKIQNLEIHDDDSATITPVEGGYEAFITDPGWAEANAGNEDDPGVYLIHGNGHATWLSTEAFNKTYIRVK